MDGRRFLEQVIDDRLASESTGNTTLGITVENLAEIKGMALGLAAAGVLSEQEMRDVLATAGIDPRRGPVAVRTHAAPVFRPRDARRSVVLEATKSRVAPSPSGSLLRVVPLTGQEIPLGDTSLILISAEVWSTMLALRLAHAVGRPPGLQAMAECSIHVQDSLGTLYRSCGAAASDAGGIVFQERFFHPGPPDGTVDVVLTARYRDAVATTRIELS